MRLVELARHAAAAATEPSPQVTGEPDRRKARLLAAVLLVAVPIGAATTVLTAIVEGRGLLASPTGPMGLAVSGLGALGYLLARSRHVHAAAWLVVGLAWAGAWAGGALAGLGPDDPALFFLGISVVLASLLLGTRATILVASLNMVGVLALPALVPGLGVGGVLDPAMFLLFLSALILVFSAVRGRDLDRIEAQARQLASREGLLRSVLDHATDIILLVDRAGIIRYGNHAVPGLAPEEVVGTTVFDFVAEEERERMQALLAHVFATGEAASFEMRGTGPWGQDRVYSSRLGPVLEGARVVAATLITTDISGMKAAEEARAQSHARSVELARLRAEARFRANFINMAAHELRTPMAPIKTQMFLLRKLRSPSYSAEERAALDVLDRNVERLHASLTDLFDASRLQAGQGDLQLQPLDLGPVAAEAVAAHQAPAERARVRLVAEVPGPLPVRGDPARLHQVVSNLVGNAVRYTSPGGEVRVVAHAGPDSVVLRIVDTGDGLTEEQRAALFQPFSQLRIRADRVADGAGVGLYLTRELVERHGGQVRCESDGPGTGCTFVVELPRAPLP